MPIDAAPATEPALRPLAVGITPLETRRDVVLQVATRAEELGYTALFVAEGWGHDVSVLLAEIAHRTSHIRIGSGVINVWGRSAASLAMLATSLAPGVPSSPKVCMMSRSAHRSSDSAP